MSGSPNNINVLQHPLLLKRLCDREALARNYTVKGHGYNMGYYLACTHYFKNPIEHAHLLEEEGEHVVNFFYMHPQFQDYWAHVQVFNNLV